MPVQVLPGQTVRHNGVIYKAEQIIQNLADDIKAELVKLKVVKDLDVSPGAEAAAKADLSTVETQAKSDEELARGQVDQQVVDAAKADVEAAEATLKAPGTLVEPGGKKPTNQEVAATAAKVT